MKKVYEPEEVVDVLYLHLPILVEQLLAQFPFEDRHKQALNELSDVLMRLTIGEAMLLCWTVLASLYAQYLTQVSAIQERHDVN